MTKSPLFLAAFANSEDSWLPNLIQEEQNLRETLYVLHDENRMEFLVLGRTGIDDIYREFNRFYGRIQVFHFSGHTDSRFLELVDQSHRASSLANLISMEKQLKLVVLNGCANKDQVFALLDAGVGAVIATKTPVRDDKATVFSAQFYRAMVGGRTIKEAFLTATEYLKETHEGFHDDVAIRGIDKEDDVQLVPWGLYYREEAGGEWCFPGDPITQMDLDDYKRFREEVTINHPEVNKILTINAAEGMSGQIQEVKLLLDLYNLQQDENQDTSEVLNNLQNRVIEKFPFPVAIRLRDLFTPDASSKGRMRLEKLNEAYLSLSKFMATIAVANLWQSMHEVDEPVKFKIRPEYRKDIKEYLMLDEGATQRFDYVWIFATVQRVLEDNKVPYFVEELASISRLLSNDPQVYAAYRFLEQEIRHRLLRKDIAAEEVGNLCVEGERQLAVLMNSCSFLATYELISVSDIYVRNRPMRNYRVHYEHQRAVLRGKDLGGIIIKPLQREAYTYDRSIILTRSLANYKENIASLSPFIIDLNAFSNPQISKYPNLQIFHSLDKDGNLVYESMETEGRYFTLQQANQSDDKGLSTVVTQMNTIKNDFNL